MTNRRKNRRGGRRNLVTRAQLKRREGGYAPRGRFDPARVVSTPWNTVVLAGLVSYDSAGIKSFTVANVVDFLKKQIGIANNTFPILLRFEYISLWSTLTALATTGGTYMSLRPSDLVAMQPGKWLEDEGTVARPAHVHWVWPESNRQMIFNSTSDKDKIVFYIDVGGPFQPFFHIRVLWRPNGGDPIPTYRSFLVGSDEVASITSSTSVLSLDNGSEQDQD